MRIKDLPIKTKRTPTETNWKDDEELVRLRKSLRKFGREALEEFATTKATVIDIQRQRIKKNRITHDEVISKGMRQLSESVARDKAFRSNLAGLLVEVIDRVAFMKDSISLVRRKLKANYSAQLRKMYGAVAVQDDAIGDYFSHATAAIKAGELVAKIIDIIIADIDSGGHGNQKLLRTAELVFHPGRAD